jgi:aspartyl-tRNA(Asn)/glutamyl-tRNA(Gln) amidotransferase subunit C
MASTLTRADVLRVAELARLDLTDGDIDLFTSQLTAILGFAAEIHSIDTTGIRPTSHTFANATVWRDDHVRPSLEREAVLDAAPGAAPAAGLFKVPKVL